MDVIDELIACCEVWEPEVCVMGNVSAGEAAKALRGLRADLTMAGAFHKAAVAQRNSAWEEIEHLRAELAECKEMLDEASGYVREDVRRMEDAWAGYITDVAIDSAVALLDRIETARKGEGE